MSKSPIDCIVSEMNGCVGAGFPIAAISLAISLPSICASLEMADGRAQGQEYKAWCKKNLYPKKGFDAITPEEILSIRNGFSHQSRTEIKNNRKSKLEQISDVVRIVFILQNAFVSFKDSFLIDESGKSYCYDIEKFCSAMGDAALGWLERNSGSPQVQANLQNMATYRRIMDVPAIF